MKYIICESEVRSLCKSSKQNAWVQQKRRTTSVGNFTWVLMPAAQEPLVSEWCDRVHTHCEQAQMLFNKNYCFGNVLYNAHQCLNGPHGILRNKEEKVPYLSTRAAILSITRSLIRCSIIASSSPCNLRISPQPRHRKYSTENLTKLPQPTTCFWQWKFRSTTILIYKYK